MKPKPRNCFPGFTVVELLVIVALVAILFAMAVTIIDKPDRGGKRTSCMSQLRLIGMAAWVYASENRDRFPIPRAFADPSQTNLVSESIVAPVFQKTSIYLRDLKNLVCPLDSERHAVTNIDKLKDGNISYFLNSDVVITNAARYSIFSGDRFLRANGRAVKSGWFLLTTNSTMTWLPDRHSGRGNLGFADGHVESTQTNFDAIVRSQPQSTNFLAIP